jgi:hypothetical protein
MPGILQTLFLGAAAAVKDVYFNLVTLLLNTTATNGAQNNTFLDSSTNNFSITRNGNTTQGTFTPFSQTGWSNYAGASSSYITATSQPLITGNDWTVEFWMFPTQYNNNGGIFGASNGGGTIPKLYLYVTGGNFQLLGYSGGFNQVLTTTPPTLNQWTYVSVSRSSSTGNAYLYYNGVLQGSAATFPAITGITGGFTLFSDGEGAGPGLYGYISSMRVSDIARYTGSSYSVPTAPSTAIANTTLLTAQSNRFVDNSSNNYTLAVTGTPSIQAFSPFAPTTAYSTSLVGGSGYFDGTGDYLGCGSQSAYAFGTGNFTFEAWVYVSERSANYNIAATRGSGATVNGWNIHIGTNGAIYVFTDAFVFNGVGTVPLNSWTHVVFTRSGTGTNQTVIYINGVSVGTATNSQDFSNTTLGVGNANDGSQYPFLGYISNVRLVKGTAVYTSNFTPPTAPLTAITNTSLLLSATNAGIYDAAAKNVAETVGNAQVSTTTAQFGATSMYFDGTGDCLIFRPTPNFLFGGDFTIEGWFNRDNGVDNSIFVMETSGANYFALNVASTGYSVYLNATGPNFSPSVTLSNNTWYHVALVRSGSTVTLYHNGTSVGSTTNSSALGSASVISYVGGINGGLKAYIDELRITKYARYTANFTPPAAAFPVQ